MVSDNEDDNGTGLEGTMEEAGSPPNIPLTTEQYFLELRTRTRTWDFPIHQLTEPWEPVTNPQEEEDPETAPANLAPCPTPTPVSKLPVKPPLPKGLAIKCRVTFVRSPSDFYVRPVSEGEGLEPGERAVGGILQGLAVPSRLDRRLNASLSMDTEFHYKKLQVASYLLRSEVVAVRIPTPDGKWNRAVMYSSHIPDVNSLVPPSGRCQLLDTGEWVEVMMSEVCRLPEQFCGAHAAAYRCKLFRVSPRDGGWEENGVRIFKELAEGKEVMVTFKERFGAEPDQTRVMERVPYVVKVLVDETGTGERWTDVAQKLIEAPSRPGVEWDLALSIGRTQPVLKVPELRREMRREIRRNGSGALFPVDGRTIDRATYEALQLETRELMEAGIDSCGDDSSDSNSYSVASDQTIASSVADSGPNPFWRIVDWLTKNDFLGEGPLLPGNQGDEGANRDPN